MEKRINFISLTYPKTIYIDRNIFIDIFNGKKPELTRAIENCKKNGICFPYSPAHIEEIVKAKCVNKIDPSKELKNIKELKELENIKELSDEKAFRPVKNGSITSCAPTTYPVNECLYNVVKHNGRKKTEQARDQDFIEKCLETVLMPEEHKKTRKRIERLSCDQVLQDEELNGDLQSQKILPHLLIESPLDFDKRRDLIDSLYKRLEYFGFRPEDNEEKIENRMHDITHTIYASYAKKFISNDRKLRAKAKVIFRYFKIYTQVLNPKEFIKYANNLTKIK